MNEVYVTWGEAESYHREKKYQSDLKECYQYWTVRNWQMNGKKIIDWKKMIDYWENGYNERISPTNQSKVNSFKNFEQREYSNDEILELERIFVNQNYSDYLQKQRSSKT